MSTEYTLQDQLNEVNKAIQTVLVGGQSYKIGSRSLTRADLKMLRMMQSDLIAQISARKQSSLLDHTFVAIFDGR